MKGTGYAASAGCFIGAAIAYGNPWWLLGLIALAGVRAGAWLASRREAGRHAPGN